MTKDGIVANEIVRAWEWKGHQQHSVRVWASRATPDEYPGRCDENTFVPHTIVAEVHERDGRWHARVWHGGMLNPISTSDGKKPASFVSQQEAENAADYVLASLSDDYGWTLE